MGLRIDGHFFLKKLKDTNYLIEMICLVQRTEKNCLCYDIT